MIATLERRESISVWQRFYFWIKSFIHRLVWSVNDLLFINSNILLYYRIYCDTSR